FIYFGSDVGAFHRLHDPGTPPSGSDLSTASLCGGSCSAAWAVNAGPSGDVVLKRPYIAANGRVFAFAVGPGAWGPTAQSSLNTPAGAAGASSPMLDRASGNLYVGYYSTLYRLPYPLVAGSFAMGAPLFGAGSVGMSPLGSPLVYNGSVYTGDGA